MSPLPLARKALFLGTWIHCKTLGELEICPSGAIGIDEKGAIAFVERDVADLDTFELPEGWVRDEIDITRTREGQFFFPGFIDTHIHASQYPNAGLFGKSTLLDWLSTYTFPMESSLSSAARARSVYSRCVSRTLSHGTTTAAYYATLHVDSTNLLADICLAAGQRAFVGRCCMDSDMNPDYYKDASPAQAMDDTEATIAHIKRIDPSYSLVSPILTPRFAPSCSSELLGSLGKLAAAEDLPIQTHIAENPNEVELVKTLFPGSKSYTGVYDDHGLLTPRTILAHAIHLGPEEIELCAKRQAKISHCPASNSALTSGGAKVRLLLNSGVEVGLGTDVSGGYSPSMLEAVRSAALVSRHVAMRDGDAAKLSIEEVLYLGTRGGAKVCGLEDKVGGFEVGKEFDALLVGLTMVPPEVEDGEGVMLDPQAFSVTVEDGPVDLFPWETNWEDRVAKWVFNGDDRNTLAVWVQGRCVFERRPTVGGGGRSFVEKGET